MTLPTGSESGLSLAVSAEPVVRLEGVSVRYQVPHERIHTFKEYTIRLLQRRVANSEFWALRDVSLEVYRGEVLGIVGRNGAGKSTLLKVVARVLRPTQGRVWIKGQVAPLLEFQAGFHPELSGRENVFLNGTLLGHTQREMQAKFEGIVDFAELAGFIDAPVRTYSSGMVARLGFAIATDTQPDILIVDEVLSVGDEGFRQKSSRRMERFRERGATILLVTHSLDTLRAMCTRALWIDQGVIRLVGTPDEVVRAYLGG